MVNDGYARQVLKAGQDLGISERGIVIAFATVFVESNWVMYANNADPESLSFPHEALSFDANSVGLFQQRAEWWGTCADRMDPYRSAVLFFNSLKRYDYNDLSRSPGYWAQKVQGSAFPDRYDTRMGEAQALYNRLSTPRGEPMEKVLSYSRSALGAYDGVAQQHPWDCGPASAQIVLQSAGVIKSEQWLIDQIGTTTNGTNHSGLITPVLNKLLPGSGYKVVWITKEPVSGADVSALWSNVTKSIDGGRGCIFNFVAPPWNFPRGSNGSSSPNYRGNSTVYHYVACMGYAVDSRGGRHFWIADPGFSPFGYWCSLEQVASLIVPHSYAYASTPPQIAPPAPLPQAPAESAPESPTEPPSHITERLLAVLGELLALIEANNPELLRKYLTLKGPQ